MQRGITIPDCGMAVHLTIQRKIGLMHGQLHHMKGFPRMETLQMTDFSTLMANYSEHVRILHLLVCLRPHIVP